MAIASGNEVGQGQIHDVEHVQTVVVGGGQAGLAVGYSLAQRGLPFVVLDAHERIGDAWRNRWDSLRLFSAARYDGLPGMPFPGPADSFPTKDEMADYLEAYAARFELPVRTKVTVDRLRKRGDRFEISAGAMRFEADNVVVAMGSHQVPWMPPFADKLDLGIVQLHAAAYRNPSQLREGGVLVVGVGNSGGEIALEVTAGHPTALSGKEVGHVPFRIESPLARRVVLPLLFRVIAHRVLTVDTPIGRKIRPKLLHGQPLVRVKPRDLAVAGIQRVPRVVDVVDGVPLLEDGRTLEVANVIWCTGYRPAFSWIDLPVFDEARHEPMHYRGIVSAEPGLYFVGLSFLYAMSSGFLPGVGRDAEHIGSAISGRAREPVPGGSSRSIITEEGSNRLGMWRTSSTKRSGGTAAIERQERMAQFDTTRARLQAAIVAVAPVVLLAGFVYHPYLHHPTDPRTIAAAAAADTTRWGFAHLAIAVGYGLAVLAFIAIRSYLREAGEERWSARALPFIVMGSTLFGVLPGMEFTPLAAAEAGGDAQAAQAALIPWFVPVLVTGGVSFALGAVGFAVAIVRSAVINPMTTRLVVGSLLVMAAARFVPLSAAPYVIAVAGIVALWPLAFAMWKRAEARPTEEPRPMPAT